MQEIENNFKKDIKKEEEELKKEQNNLVAQKSVLSEEQFKEKENELQISFSRSSIAIKFILD